MDFEKTYKSHIIESLAIPLILIFGGLDIFIASVIIICDFTLTGVVIGYTLQVVGIWLLSGSIIKLIKTGV